jgi:hypothetical protein
MERSLYYLGYFWILYRTVGAKQMKSISFITVIMVVVATELYSGTAQAQPVPPRPYGEDGVQVLTRGPVHEAFAETVTYDPGPGILVTRPPPEPIEEVVPDQRPDGVDVTWIPGYTAWDDERNDYLWVSGVWRIPPPGRQWMPGYWGTTQQGFQWTAGYWADEQLNEVEYLPEPPETVEVGPSGIPPSSDHNWIPGAWVWVQGRYAWRPGYWVAGHANWDWVPSHYNWAPRGYVFVDGYWDHSIQNRGVLFAPVYFDAGVYSRRDYRYRPSTVISLGVFSDHLFVRPRYNHYYFGDYYDAGYQDAGFYSRFSFRSSRRGYDPIYTHQRWTHRQDPQWDVRLQTDFRHRRDHIEARPPRTFRAQLALNTGGGTLRERSLTIGATFDNFVRSNDSSVRFRAVDNTERQTFVTRGREVRKYRDERQKLETRAADRSKHEPGRDFAPARVVTPRSPIAARRPNDLGKDRAPPARHKAPAPDPSVQAKPRKSRAPAESSKARSQERRESPAKHRKVKTDNRNGNDKRKGKDKRNDKAKRKNKDKP